MSRLSGAVAVATCLCLSLSGCAAGGPDKARADAPASTATSKASAPAYGVPAYPTADAAFAAIRDYNVRNNALMRVANRPPFARDAFAPVDTGPIMARDRWDIALAAADPAARHPKPWFYESPEAVYLPAATTWPKLVLSAATTHHRGKTPTPGKWTLLTAFVQPSEGAPLKHAAFAWALRSKLPKPLEPDADPSVPDRPRSVALARAVAAHWTKDTDTVAGFASTKVLDADLDADRRNRSGPNSYRWNVRLLGGAQGVRTVAVQGGTLVLADYRVDKTITALGLGTFVYWTGDYAKVLGGDKRRSISVSSYLAAAWFQPAGGGGAVPLGTARVPAVF